MKSYLFYFLVVRVKRLMLQGEMSKFRLDKNEGPAWFERRI
jgi:hypothetical protein